MLSQTLAHISAQEPHLLTVPTDDPFRNPYYHEYEKMPFSRTRSRPCST